MSQETDKLWEADPLFRHRLKAARTAQGYSQKQLSELCGGKPSERTISDWERGLVKTPHLVDLHRVATLLREDVLWLLKGVRDVDAFGAWEGRSS